MKIGVVVGRFQVPELHAGHRHVLDWAQRHSDVLAVVLGVAPRIDKRNPLDYLLRSEMIRREYPRAAILPLEDQRDDAEWCRRLDSLLYRAFPSTAVTFYGSRDSFLQVYKGYNKTQYIDHHCDLSGTDLRDVAHRERTGKEFAAGVIHAVSQVAPSVVPAVDIALVRGQGMEHNADVLMIRKAGEDGVRFPGGHVDRIDASYEAAARRELLEETTLQAQQLYCVGSMRVPDWRYRGCSVLTTLFTGITTGGEPKAGSDASSVEWVPLDWQRRNVPGGPRIVEEHVELFAAVLRFYGKGETENGQPDSTH